MTWSVISRFCHALNTTVVGGFSKLLTHALEHEGDKSIFTYTDLRYGTGDYLNELGFRKVSTHVSFKWVMRQQTFHRLKFPGNSGYKQGCYKLWDCGQAKWVLA